MALAREHLGAVEAEGADADEDLRLAGLGVGDGVGGCESEDGGRAGGGAEDCAHCFWEGGGHLGGKERSRERGVGGGMMVREERD